MGPRWPMLGLLVATLAVACGQPQPRSDSRTNAGGSEIPPRLGVICYPDGSTELVDNEVTTQPDGVHIRVDNRSDEFVSLNGLGLDFSEGITEQVARAAPGEVKIACWPGSMHEGPEPKLLPIQIHDVDSYWVEAELECPRDDLIMDAINDYGSDSRGSKGDPEEIARRDIEGVKSTDSVFTFGYPEAADPQVAIERDDETIALVSFSPAPKGGWLLSGYSACPSSGIRG